MIFLISQKKFVKNDKKLLKVRDYIIVDGADAGTYDLDTGSKNAKDIANVYSNVTVNGAFTPPGNLLQKVKREYKKLGKKKDDLALYDDDNDGKPELSWKTQAAVDGFLEDKSTIAAFASVVKGQLAIGKGIDSQRNIFVVVPDDVYKYLGDTILNYFYKLFKVDFRFVVSQEELLENPKKWLLKDLSQKKINELDRRLEKVVKKYKLDK